MKWPCHRLGYLNPCSPEGKPVRRCWGNSTKWSLLEKESHWGWVPRSGEGTLPTHRLWFLSVSAVSAASSSCHHHAPPRWVAPWNCKPKETPLLPFSLLPDGYFVMALGKVTKTLGAVVHGDTPIGSSNQELKVILSYIPSSRLTWTTWDTVTKTTEVYSLERKEFNCVQR